MFIMYTFVQYGIS